MLQTKHIKVGKPGIVVVLSNYDEDKCRVEKKKQG